VCTVHGVTARNPDKQRREVKGRIACKAANNQRFVKGKATVTNKIFLKASN